MVLGSGGVDSECAALMRSTYPRRCPGAAQRSEGEAAFAEALGDLIHQLAVACGIERGSGGPVVEPDGAGAQLSRLVAEAGEDVAVERGLLVAEDLVVDAERAG